MYEKNAAFEKSGNSPPVVRTAKCRQRNELHRRRSSTPSGPCHRTASIRQDSPPDEARRSWLKPPTPVSFQTEQLLTVADAAHAAGVLRHHIMDAYRRGELMSVALKGQCGDLRILRSSLDCWMECGR